MSNLITRSVVVAMLASWTIAGEAAPTESPAHDGTRLLLRVGLRTEVPAIELVRAEDETLRVFERIGVTAEWTGCGVERRGEATAGARLAVDVVIASHESRAMRAIPREVLGTVVRDDRGRETAWALFDRIQRAADGVAVDAGLVLGHTIAHEVGHLLLPRGTHGPEGLMQARWRRQELVDAVQGHLGFTTSEALQMRGSLNRLAQPRTFVDGEKTQNTQSAQN